MACGRRRVAPAPRRSPVSSGWAWAAGAAVRHLSTVLATYTAVSMARTRLRPFWTQARSTPKLRDRQPCGEDASLSPTRAVRRGLTRLMLPATCGSLGEPFGAAKTAGGGRTEHRRTCGRALLISARRRKWRPRCDNTWWPLSTRRGDPQIQSARRRNAASAGTWRRGRFGESRPESSHRVT